MRNALSATFTRRLVFALLITVMLLLVVPVACTAAYDEVEEQIVAIESVRFPGFFINISYGKDTNLQNIDVYIVDPMTGKPYKAMEFKIVKYKNSYAIVFAHSKSGRVVNTNSNTTAQNGQNVMLFDRTNHVTQLWYFDEVSTGNYIIRSASNPNVVLNCVGAYGNVNVATYKAGVKNQIWKLVPINAPKVSSIKLSKTSVSINDISSTRLTATTVPANSSVTWSSSNTSVATVSGGIVSGKSPGTATITAKAGDKSATCKVTVTDSGTMQYQYAILPFQFGTINEWRWLGFHKDQNAYDFSDVAYAPFDCKVVWVEGVDAWGHGGYINRHNAVVFQSVKKVRLADGSIDYVSFLAMHGNTAQQNNLAQAKRNGTVYRQGTRIYNPGTFMDGNANGCGLHVHVAVWKGTNYMSTLESGAYYSGNIDIEKVFWYDGSFNYLSNLNKYTYWKTKP